MFIGRDRELQELNRLFESDRFEWFFQISDLDAAPIGECKRRKRRRIDCERNPILHRILADASEKLQRMAQHHRRNQNTLSPIDLATPQAHSPSMPKREDARPPVQFNYPLMPASVMPFTICFSKMMKNTRIGIDAIMFTVIGTVLSTLN